MTTVKNNQMDIYNNLGSGDCFIYAEAGIEFFAFKHNDEYAIFVSGDGKFIVAKAYKNCLSIGWFPTWKFDTYNDAVEAIDNGKVRFD